ncbi:copper resistance protein CopC [Actinoallomurus purpureus]|uniref:copper resistance CopC family protein n=1 Tax=Actinoallomurus purpureus TaxID=478114 RepID=UPI002092FE7C|nr:copper resistance protein CopC [Actinoallomurus purpureus]MCO6006093.1 copper resistance protein CopC [Actinoallomurus purpureus]
MRIPVRAGRRPVSRLAAAIAAVAVTGLLTAAPADAHTTLTAAVPAKGSKVPSPARIKLTFAEAVRFPGIVVLDAKGGHHESGKAHATDATVTEQVAGVLPPGVYTVGWRVVADDGHPVTGDYKFTVVGGTSPSPTAGSPATGSSTAGSAAPAAAVPSSTPAARRTTDTSSAGWWWVGLGAVIVAAVAGVGVLLRRRRAART